MVCPRRGVPSSRVAGLAFWLPPTFHCPTRKLVQWGSSWFKGAGASPSEMATATGFGALVRWELGALAYRRIGMRTLPIIALLALSLPSCGDDRPPMATCIERHGVKAGVDKEPNYDADLGRWELEDGCDLRLDVVMTRDNDCTNDTDVLIGWPPGNPSRGLDAVHIYVEDPDPSMRDEDVVEGYDDYSVLPDNAVDTSFRRDDEGFWVRKGAQELWTVAGDDAFIYIVANDGVRRLPRDEGGPVCV